jgi:hypothetical protein
MLRAISVTCAIFMAVVLLSLVLHVEGSSVSVSESVSAKYVANLTHNELMEDFLSQVKDLHNMVDEIEEEATPDAKIGETQRRLDQLVHQVYKLNGTQQGLGLSPDDFAKKAKEEMKKMQDRLDAKKREMTREEAEHTARIARKANTARREQLESRREHRRRMRERRDVEHYLQLLRILSAQNVNAASSAELDRRKMKIMRYEEEDRKDRQRRRHVREHRRKRRADWRLHISQKQQLGTLKAQMSKLRAEFEMAMKRDSEALYSTDLQEERRKAIYQNKEESRVSNDGKMANKQLQQIREKAAQQRQELMKEEQIKLATQHAKWRQHEQGIQEHEKHITKMLERSLSQAKESAENVRREYRKQYNQYRQQANQLADKLAHGEFDS